MSSYKRNDVVTLTQSLNHIWIERTEAEFQALRDRDAAAGRWCNDAGESILYGPYNGWPEGLTSIQVKVTKLRGIAWKSFTNRPIGLVEGYCEDLCCNVLFKDK